MLDYHGCGQSVMEMSHRSKIYKTIIEGAEALLREVMNIPDNYKVLFLQGGASTQFAAIPLNLMNGSGKADYVITGQWANKAFKEAARYGEAKAVASSADKTYFLHSEARPCDLHQGRRLFLYLHEQHHIRHQIPRAARNRRRAAHCRHFFLHYLSRAIDVSKFGMLYAGAQKNVAPAGLTIVIIREDLLGHARDITPTMLNYVTHAEAGSMFNTPPAITYTSASWFSSGSRTTSAS